MIFYAIVGLPVNAILFAYLGNFWSKSFERIYERYKSYKMQTNRHYVPRKFSLIMQILMYLIPGIIIFLFLPAFVFSYFEGWSYVVSFYYSFVTLTTIGFGDYAST
jgi:Ion channel